MKACGVEGVKARLEVVIVQTPVKDKLENMFQILIESQR